MNNSVTLSRSDSAASLSELESQRPIKKNTPRGCWSRLMGDCPRRITSGGALMNCVTSGVAALLGNWVLAGFSIINGIKDVGNVVELNELASSQTAEDQFGRLKNRIKDLGRVEDDIKSLGEDMKQKAIDAQRLAEEETKLHQQTKDELTFRLQVEKKIADELAAVKKEKDDLVKEREQQKELFNHVRTKIEQDAKTVGEQTDHLAKTDESLHSHLQHIDDTILIMGNTNSAEKTRLEEMAKNIKAIQTLFSRAFSESSSAKAELQALEDARKQRFELLARMEADRKAFEAEKLEQEKILAQIQFQITKIQEFMLNLQSSGHVQGDVPNFH